MIPDDEELREELVEALLGTRRSWDPEEIRDIVGDLLPVVERYGARRAAWLLEAVLLLNSATSNSTDPVERETWRRGRSRLLGELAER